MKPGYESSAARFRRDKPQPRDSMARQAKAPERKNTAFPEQTGKTPYFSVTGFHSLLVKNAQPKACRDKFEARSSSTAIAPMIMKMLREARSKTAEYTLSARIAAETRGFGDCALRNVCLSARRLFMKGLLQTSSLIVPHGRARMQRPAMPYRSNPVIRPNQYRSKLINLLFACKDAFRNGSIVQRPA